MLPEQIEEHVNYEQSLFVYSIQPNPISLLH